MLEGFEISILLVLSNIIFIILNFKNNKYGFFAPTIFIPFLILVFIILGNVNLYFYQNIIGWFKNIKPNQGNLVALISLLVANLIIINSSIKNINNINNVKLSLSRFKYIIIIMSIISLIINIINYYSIGGILIFKGDLTGYERFDIINNLPFARGIVLSSSLICPLLISIYFNKKNRVLFLILLILNIIFAFGLGQRHAILMPIMMTFIFLFSLGYLNKKLIYSFFLLFPLLIIGSSLLRGDGENVAFSSYTTIFGGEYRDYLRLREDNIPFQNGKTLYPIILNAIPKQLFGLFDLDKDDFRIYSAYILSNYWGNQTGQRAGIWGEFYLNFGDFGVFFGFLFYSLFLVYVEKKLLYKNNVQSKFIISYIYSLFIFSILGSWATIGDDIGSYGLIYYFIYKFGFIKV